MNYQLQGHDYRHAVEEMLIHLFPTDRPIEVADMPVGENRCVSSLQQSGQEMQSTATVCIEGQTHIATRSCQLHAQDDILERRRRESECVRLAIYDAGVQFLPQKPEWGSLTGVRPAKLVRTMLARGCSNAQAAKLLREHYDVSTTRAALTIRVAAVAQDCQKKLATDEVSVYIGIPFCPSRCAYCSFVSASVAQSSHQVAPYVQALCEEVKMTGALLQQHQMRIKTIYIGGGTPTTLTHTQLTQLMDTISTHMDLQHICEYTVEAGRPDTITAEKLQAIAQGGADRISINPQSMQDEVLARIGREHSAAQVLESYALARKIGFKSINMDVIAGLDGDTPMSFMQTMDTIVALAPENITVHTLAIKRAATLHDKADNAQKRESVGCMLEYAQKILTKAGYAPYYLYRQKFTAGGFENVGWSKEGHICLYNVCMMEELQSIVSLGAGAVSKCVAGQGRISRYANPKYATEYLSAADKMKVAREKLLAEISEKESL